MQRAAAALIVVVLSVAAATALAAPAPTSRQSAGRACAARNAAEARVEPEDTTDRDQVLRFYRVIARAQRTLVARLAPLRPPRDDRPAFARLLVAERDVTPLLDEAVRLLEHGATPAAVQGRLGRRFAAVSARIDRVAGELRLPACRG